ncbi:MAG TPA: phosphotransferase family protein [Stellaceae bacterium]|nr:phosphotransferase family protein [Stellaceae bacterium]
MRAALARFLAEATGARSVAIEELRRLPNGAVTENWLLAAGFAGGMLGDAQRLVLRTNAATGLGIGLGRAEEFAVQRVVHGAGVAVPQPLLLGSSDVIIGKPFYLMRWLPGEAAGAAIVAGQFGGRRDRLLRRLAAELALLHAIRPPKTALSCLGTPPADPARHRLDQQERLLAEDPDPHPVAAWGIAWLRRHLPRPVNPVLCHGDFRTGNFLADTEGLVAILDWEFAGWSDPAEDLGWFCLGCWRFGAYGQEAGGIGSRDAFYRDYARASGRSVDPERVRWWEVMAALRWLVIALRQRDRCLMGGERSLDLALSGRRPAECELEILKLTGDG